MFGFKSLKELYTVLSAKPVEGGRSKVLLIAKFASDVALNVFFFLILLTFCKTDAVCIKLVVVVFAFTSSINFCFSCVRSAFFRFDCTLTIFVPLLLSHYIYLTIYLFIIYLFNLTIFVPLLLSHYIYLTIYLLFIYLFNLTIFVPLLLLRYI